MERDLWGNPIVPPSERRGRPKHEATDDSRLVVKVMAALNKRHGEIAEALGLSEPTLRKCYRAELAGGRAQVRAEVLFLMMREAKAGNVAAMKLILAQFDRADADEARRSFDGAEPPAPTPRRGKKEVAQDDAETAGVGTEWGEDLHAGPSPKLN